MKQQRARNEPLSINFWPSITDFSLIVVLILILLIFAQIVSNTEAFKLQRIRDKQEAVKSLILQAVGEDRIADITFSNAFETQYISFADNILFRPARAVLQRKGIELLDAVGNTLNENSDLFESIQIAGHTDKQPISTSRFSSNWELSSARATAVVKHFDEDLKMNPENIPMSAVGYSKYRPVDSDDTPEAYAKNRRIEMMIIYNAD